MATSTRSTRGSILLTTLFIIAATAAVAYAVYTLALATYRLSQRNEYTARAKAVAESELEYVYFRIRDTMSRGHSFDQVPNELQDICDIPANSNLPGLTCTPTTERDVFVASQRQSFEQWKVKRSISYQNNGTGTVNRLQGIFYYYTVKVEVYSNNPALVVIGPIDVRLGRSMSCQKSSIFQFNIFSQGNLEFAPTGHTTINGDIAANGIIYMGTRANDLSSPTLTINAYVSFLAQPSDVSSPWSNSVFLNQLVDGGTTTNLNAPIFGSDSDQTVAFQKQVAPMTEPINLLAGLSPEDLASKYAEATTGGVNYGLFGKNSDSNAATEQNLVYHSVIAPPPAAAYAASQNGHNDVTSYLADYPDVTSASDLQAMTDDPGVAALRAYNRAGLVITVNGDGTATYQTRDSSGTMTTISVASADSPLSSATMYDMREGKNVAITDINVATLKSNVIDHITGFNGMLYVYVAGTPQTTGYVGPNPDPLPDPPPAPVTYSELPAIRLNNGAATPGVTALRGFSVATNGGLYVKGDYNTTTSDGGPIATDGSNLNPAMLMADAVTILSSSWDDATVTSAGPSDPWDAYKRDPNATIYSASWVSAHLQSDSNPDGDFGTTDPLLTGPDSNGHTLTDFQGTLVGRPAAGPRVATAGTTTIGAGILTGNITQAVDGSGHLSDTTVYSGGGSNLIRFVEDWTTSGSTANFYGSIGRLFQSTQLTHAFQQTYTGVYRNPATRLFSFNSTLRSKPPPQSPDDTKYDRGTLFFW